MTNKLLPCLLLLAAVAIAFFAGRCSRDVKDNNVVNIPAEAERKAEIQKDTTARAEYRKAAQYWQTRYTTLQRDSAEAKQAVRQAEQKARQSAAEYARNPNLNTCHHALVDCKEENETKAYSIAVQDRMLNAADSLDVVQNKEIARAHTATDSAFAGWGKANKLAGDLEMKYEREKRKRFGVGVQVGYGASSSGISPYVGVGVSYNLARF